MTDLEQALDYLRAGKLVAIPTETVYGLGADADNPKAIERVYCAKERPRHNPLIVHLAKAEAMQDWAIDIPQSAWILAEACWPGPLTLILKRHPRVSTNITAGQDTVALRVPAHPLTLALLAQFKGGIVAPSANPYGYLSPTTADHVRKTLGTRVDYILDGGPCRIGIESTIIYLVGDHPIIVREGAFSASLLSDLLKQSVLSKALQEGLSLRLQSPGLDKAHYAPRKPLYLLDRKAIRSLVSTHPADETCCGFSGIHAPSYGVLSFGAQPEVFNHQLHTWIQMPMDPNAYAQQLYGCLHRLDNSAIESILVEAVPQTETWLAIQDRLQRAANAST